MSKASIFGLTNPEIYVVTTAFNGLPAGQVATWVTLASLVPDAPRVTVILSPCTHTSSVLQKSKGFVLNLLSAHQAPWLERFGLQSGFTEEKFQGLSYQNTAQGWPVLPDTCGWAICHASQQIELGDRVIWVADVVEQSLTSDHQPLRRVEGLNALPDEVRSRLSQQRLADIERDRPLR